MNNCIYVYLCFLITNLSFSFLMDLAKCLLNRACTEVKCTVDLYRFLYTHEELTEIELLLFNDILRQS